METNWQPAHESSAGKEVLAMLRKRYQLRAIAHCKEGCWLRSRAWP